MRDMDIRGKPGAFYTGQYTNLFNELGYSNQKIDQKVVSAWEALFGTHADTRIYYPVDGSLAYVLDTGNLDVRTEGMSYRMMIRFKWI